MAQRLFDGMLQLERGGPRHRRISSGGASFTADALPIELVCNQRLVHSSKHSAKVIPPVEAAGQRSNGLDADEG